MKAGRIRGVVDLGRLGELRELEPAIAKECLCASGQAHRAGAPRPDVARQATEGRRSRAGSNAQHASSTPSTSTFCARCPTAEAVIIGIQLVECDELCALSPRSLVARGGRRGLDALWVDVAIAVDRGDPHARSVLQLSFVQQPTKPSGLVQSALRLVPQPYATVPRRATISDGGCGLLADTLGRLFRPWQVASSASMHVFADATNTVLSCLSFECWLILLAGLAACFR